MVLKIDAYLKRTNKFTRFLLVGILNTLTGLTIIFMLLHVVGLSYWFSTFVGNALGATVSYFLNRSFTFRSQVNLTVGALKFIAVILVCYFSAYSLSEFLAGWIWDYSDASASLPIGEKEIAILLGSLLYTFMNYVGQKNLVFKSKVSGNKAP
jgi:putative flippase GtrA